MFSRIFILLSVCALSLQETITFNNGGITVNLTNCGARTHFEITAPILNGVNIDASWLGLTLDTNFSSLADSNLIACKKNGSTVSVEQFVYIGSQLVHMNSSNKFTGLNSLVVNANGNIMTCKFTRENKDRDPLYLNMNTQKLFMKISYGSLSGDALQNAVSEYPSSSAVDFPVHQNCEQWTSLDNDRMMVKFRNYGSKTMYEANVLIGNGVSIDNVWLGVGINFNRKMPGADVVICKRNLTYNSVEHYYNEGLNPRYIDDTNKFIGLSSMYVGANGNYLTCRFTRDNKNANPKYIYQNGEDLFVMVAYGTFTSDVMLQHALVKESKNIVSFPIQPSFEDYTTLDNENLRVEFKNCGKMTHFTVTAVIGNGVSIDNVWVGMGLNINRKMPGTDVVICKRNTTFNSVEHYYNDGLIPKYMNLSNKFEGLSSMSISVSGNVLTCKFSRDNSNPNPFYKNLNTENLYVISGYGSFTGDEILVHNLIKESKNVVKFPVAPRCTQFTTLNDDKIRIEFKNYGQKTDFTAIALIENGININNVWLGFGLNLNRKMPNTDVVVCKKNNTILSVEHYYNDNLQPRYINESNKFVGLSSMSITTSGNTMICKFTRDNSYPDPKYKDLNTESLFIHAAYGKMENNELTNHVLVKETKNIVNFPVEPLIQDYTTLDNDNLKIEFINCGTITHFTVTAVIGNGVSIDNVWVGMGLNINRKMPGADVVICKRNTTFNSVEHYYNDGLVPKYMNLSNKFEGLSSMSISVSGNVLTCKFSRDNSNPNPFYKNLNTESLFVISGYGSFIGDDILVHQLIKESKNVVPFPVTPNCQDFTTLDNDKMSVKFKNYGSQTEFIATALIEKVDINSAYIAVGLNLNRKMPGASEVVCKKSGSQTYVEHYYNDGLNPVYLDDTNRTIGINKASVTVSGNYLTCRFYRDNSNSNSRYLNINTEALFVLFAYGSLSGQNLEMHSIVKESKNVVPFKVTSNDTFQSYNLGDYTIKWIERTDEIDFVFTTRVTLSNNLWTSFALSNDPIMGDDNAIVCKIVNSNMIVQHYYNSGKFRPNLLNELEPSMGLTNVNCELNSGNFTCSLSRKKILPDILNYFDTRYKYYLLFAQGPTDDNGLMASHVANKVSSPVSFDFGGVSLPIVTKPTIIQIPTFVTQTTNLPTTLASTPGFFSKGDFSLFWSNEGDMTNFIFITKNIGNSLNIYSSFAFSKDSNMGDDDVVSCRINSQNVAIVERLYNMGQSTPSLLYSKNPQIGLSNILVSYSNGILNCSFSRIKSNSSVPNYFDLQNNKFYILFARGTASDSGINQHTVREQGTQLFDFNVGGTQTTTTSNRVRKPMTPVIAAGGFSSGDYKLSWNETTYYTIYSGGEGASSAKAKSLRLKRQATGADKYLAYGLSLDKSMGQDCIVVCKMINNIGTVEHYYATGKVTPSLLDPNEPTVGITDATVSYVNGNIQCKFTREKYIDSVPRYCDSSKNKYYLQIAEGSIYGGIIQKHGSDVVVSDSVIDFSVNTTFSGSVRDAAKSKAHACLMVFAWMFCVSTGIILARYYKYILPSIKIQKMMFWFQAHRAIMIFVPICSLAAFLVILADVGWKWVETTSKVSFAHSIFGMVLIGLSLIQVFFGFLRPDKDAPRRPLFNVLHKFTGMSCLTLAVVTCYLGVFIERMNLGRIGWGIMIGWTMWVLILPLLIELVQVLCAQTKSDSYQITQDKLPPVPEEGNKKLIERIKTVLLLLHLLISFGHVIALIVVIGVAEPGKFVSD